jgi:hypothetical protein
MNPDEFNQSNIIAHCMADGLKIEQGPRGQNRRSSGGVFAASGLSDAFPPP